MHGRIVTIRRDIRIQYAMNKSHHLVTGEDVVEFTGGTTPH